MIEVALVCCLVTLFAIYLIERSESRYWKERYLATCDRALTDRALTAERKLDAIDAIVNEQRPSDPL